MKEKYIAQLESQLEQLIEGTFTNFFRRRVTAHDIAMKLARSMENALRYGQDGDTRPIAPDAYTIHLNPAVVNKLQHNSPDLLKSLGEHIVELVTQSGYQLNAEPVVQLVAMKKLPESDVEVEALHTGESENTTRSMQPIPTKQEKAPQNPQLIINQGERTVILSEPVMNIGRGDDNHIVLDDPYCSRHHVQLRLRFGAYTLFDVNSRSGTTVNNIRVTEHQLQPGDIIKIGGTQMVYLTENDRSSRTGTTQSLDPVKF